VIFTEISYTGIFKGLRDNFGQGGALFLYHMGRTVGENVFLNHQKIAKSHSYKKIAKVAETMAFIMGWGRVSIYINKKKKKARVIIFDNFECELFRGSYKPQSYFMKGVISGWFSKLFESEVIVNETKCIAMGDDYCEFKVLPVER